MFFFSFFNKKNLFLQLPALTSFFTQHFPLRGLLPRFAGVAQRRWQQTPLAESICIRPAVALDFGFLENPGAGAGALDFGFLETPGC